MDVPESLWWCATLVLSPGDGLFSSLVLPAAKMGTARDCLYTFTLPLSKIALLKCCVCVTIICVFLSLVMGADSRDLIIMLCVL